MSKRIINLGGGNYNANIEGNYVEGKNNDKKERPANTSNVEAIEGEVINTYGANYTESIGGNIFEGDVVE